MDEIEVRVLLEGIKNGSIDINSGVERLKMLPFDDINYAKIDFHRSLRNGFPEVIYCENKSAGQICEIAERMSLKGVNVLATRISRDKFEELKKRVVNAEYHGDSRVAVIKNREIVETGCKIGVVSAGTADIPVAEEAVITAEFFGNSVERVYDVGVAGIHRLFANIEKIRSCDVVIVVAGMEGALASVVGGLVESPVIAVPTSIGYGASFGGVAALLTMLNSCASGVTVVNIDNGFGAGYMAATITRAIAKKREK